MCGQQTAREGDTGGRKANGADVVAGVPGRRPNLYLQNFSTEDWSVLMTNSAYVNAIGTVAHL